jgi:hypothetical protein
MPECRCNGLNSDCYVCGGKGYVEVTDVQRSFDLPQGAVPPSEQRTSKAPSHPPRQLNDKPSATDAPWRAAWHQPLGWEAAWSAQRAAQEATSRCGACGKLFTRSAMAEHVRTMHGTKKRSMKRRRRSVESRRLQKLKAQRDVVARAKAQTEAARKMKREPAPADPLERPPGKAVCPHCGKIVSGTGLADHMRAKHSRVPTIRVDRRSDSDGRAI